MLQMKGRKKVYVSKQIKCESVVIIVQASETFDKFANVNICRAILSLM